MQGTCSGLPGQERYMAKQFTELKNTESITFLPQIKTKPDFVPSPRAYGPTQRRHLYQDGSEEYVYHPSKRVFSNIFKNQTEIDVEKLMGKKKIMASFQDQRNEIGVSSLGDKPYRYPEQAKGFYHARGLVVGSTMTYKQVGKTADTSPEPKYLYESSPKKPVNWKDRTKVEQRSEDIKAVKGLSDWQRRGANGRK